MRLPTGKPLRQAIATPWRVSFSGRRMRAVLARPVDGQVVDAALWGTTLEAFRRDPKDFEVAALLAHLLVRHGMPEGAAPVMAPALTAQTTQLAARDRSALRASSRC